MTRLLDGRHHLERFAMEQAGEVDYLITWRDNEFVGRVSLTPCRRAGANRRCFALLAMRRCGDAGGGAACRRPALLRSAGRRTAKDRAVEPGRAAFVGTLADVGGLA